jgi:hypothetical protein
MSDSKLPKAIENRSDLKLLTLDALYSIIDNVKSGQIVNISIPTNTNVFVITNFGVVEGSMVRFSNNYNQEFANDTTNEYSKMLINQAFRFRNEKISNLETVNEAFKLINDSSAIILENAVVIPHASPNNKSNYKILVLFTDQIVGLSFGERQATDF